LADELKKEFGVEVELIPASGGVFEVVYQGKLLFSKKELGRFPNEGEVASAINSRT
jgi:selenoprotein W-related protein